MALLLKTTCCSSSNCGNVTSITCPWFVCSTWSPYTVYKLDCSAIVFSSLLNLNQIKQFYVLSTFAIQKPLLSPPVDQFLMPSLLSLSFPRRHIWQILWQNRAALGPRRSSWTAKSHGTELTTKSWIFTGVLLV